MISKTTKRRLRLVLRCCFLAATVTLALPLVPWRSAAIVVPAVSPYVAVCSVIALRSFSVVAWIAVPVLVLSLFRRRWFCRNACPLGVMTEQMGRLRRGGRASVRRWPPIGTWIVLITLAGACVGYPLLLWLDPMVLFANYFALCWRPVSAAVLIPGLAVPIVLLVSALWPRSWCRRVCPLGATQELLAMPRRMLTSLRSSKETPPAPQGGRLPRRSVLAAGFGAIAFALGTRWGIFAVCRTIAAKSRLLRPPGAADESQFTGLCIRCGNCIQACPTSILQPETTERGVATFLTPIVSFERDYCRKDCNRCMEVCPSGAIARLPLAEKANVPIGIAVVDMEICLLNIAECELCIPACPYEALSTKWDEETHEMNLLVDAVKCPGCGACLFACKDAQANVIDGGGISVMEATGAQGNPELAIEVKPLTSGHEKPSD